MVQARLRDRELLLTHQHSRCRSGRTQWGFIVCISPRLRVPPDLRSSILRPSTRPPLSTSSRLSLLWPQALTLTKHRCAESSLLEAFGLKHNFALGPVDQNLPDLRDIPFPRITLALDCIDRERHQGGGWRRVVQRDAKVGNLEESETGGDYAEFASFGFADPLKNVVKV